MARPKSALSAAARSRPSPQPSPTRASSPSGPPPSHSDSPSPRRPGLTRRPIPDHWRKQAATPIQRSTGLTRIELGVVSSDDLKHKQVRQWLHLALAPLLEFREADPRSSVTRGLESVLDRTVSRVLDSKSLVDAIWRLKRYQEAC